MVIALGLLAKECGFACVEWILCCDREGDKGKTVLAHSALAFVTPYIILYQCKLEVSDRPCDALAMGLGLCDSSTASLRAE